MILIIERSSATNIIGLKREYSIWERGTTLPIRQIVQAAMVMVISPDAEQFEQILQMRIAPKNVYIAFTGNADSDIKDYARCCGYQVITYDAGHEENLINAMRSVFNAKESFGADHADIRKLFSKSDNIYYKHINDQISAENINQIQIKGRATSILSTVFYDDTFSFDAIENVFTWLKDRFSTTDIVASYSSDVAASLGLFLALD